MKIPRSVTDVIRFAMDFCIPPFIRDSRLFMYPFYFIWFKGKDIPKLLSFKRDVYYMTRDEYENFYRGVESVAHDRETDMDANSLKYMLELVTSVSNENKTLLDVGCGRGYWLKLISQKTRLETVGCDIMSSEVVSYPHSRYVQANIDELPFGDSSVDIVTCSHTLEHLVSMQPAIDELKRVANKMLIVVVPKQRYYFYSLDLHLNYFPQKEILINAMNMSKYKCGVYGGDIVYVGYKD